MRYALVIYAAMMSACSMPAERLGPSGLPPGTQARYKADLASVHLNYGNASEAAALYREALGLETAPAEQALYYHGLAQAYVSLHSEGAAREALERCLSLYEGLLRSSPEGPGQYLERFVRIADRARAKRMVDEVASALGAKTELPAILWLANIYVRVDAWSDALALYEKAEGKTAEAGVKAQLRLSQALLLTRLNSLERAEALYQSLIKEGAPEVSEAAKKNLLVLYAAQGRTDKLKVTEK